VPYCRFAVLEFARATNGSIAGALEAVRSSPLPGSFTFAHTASASPILRTTCKDRAKSLRNSSVGNPSYSFRLLRCPRKYSASFGLETPPTCYPQSPRCRRAVKPRCLLEWINRNNLTYTSDLQWFLVVKRFHLPPRTGGCSTDAYTMPSTRASMPYMAFRHKSFEVVSSLALCLHTARHSLA